MINNRKAYKIFMNLPAKNRKKLSVEYEIESVENYFMMILNGQEDFI